MQLECVECHRILSLPDEKVPVGKTFSFSCPYCKHKNSYYLDPPVEDNMPSWPDSGQFQQDAGHFQADANQLQHDGGWENQAQDSFAPQAPENWDAPPPDGFAQAQQQQESLGQQQDPSQQFSPPPPPVDRRTGDRRSGDRRASSGDSDGLNALAMQRTEVIDEATMQAMMSGTVDERPRALVVYDDESVSDMLVLKLDNLGYKAEVAVNMRDAVKQLKFADFSILLLQEDYYSATLANNHLIKAVQGMDSNSRRNIVMALISPNMVTLDDLTAFSLSFDATINSSELESTDRILMSIIARSKKVYSTYMEIMDELGMA